MKHKITFRLIGYFSAVLLLFSLIAGLLFWVLFAWRTAEIHEAELKKRAVSIADTLSQFSQRGQKGRGQSGGYGAYMRFLDEIAMSEVWLADEHAQTIQVCQSSSSLSYSELPAGAEELIAQVFAGNVVLLCIFGYLFGWIYAGYSILFQFISTRTISSFHHRYERVTLQITTMHAEKVMRAYVQKYRHGISCVEAVGGYSHKKMYLLHTVVSSYEAAEIIELMRSEDPHIIINVLKTQNFYGSFYQAPIG